jgi:hypothetical protein
MFIVGIFSWWYGAGWKQRFSYAHDRIAQTYDYFSIDLLLKTLFSPFRQISAGSVRGPIGVQLRAWFDKLISRSIGFIVRSIVIVCGTLVLALSALYHLVLIVGWLIVPMLPIIGLVLAAMGWMPWTA